LINDLDPQISNYYQFKQQHRNQESHLNFKFKNNQSKSYQFRTPTIQGEFHKLEITQLNTNLKLASLTWWYLLKLLYNTITPPKLQRTLSTHTIIRKTIRSYPYDHLSSRIQEGN